MNIGLRLSFNRDQNGNGQVKELEKIKVLLEYASGGRGGIGQHSKIFCEVSSRAMSWFSGSLTG
jgi:hypothetical protein